MKKLFLALALSTQLFAQSYYTLDNVHNLNLYFASDTEFLTPELKKSMKKAITDKLEGAGFVFGETDAYVFVVNIQAIGVEESQAIDIQVKLGEEVITKRKDNIETFAYTYLEHRLIEGYDPYEDTLDTVNLLIDGFIAAHKDDNEE